MSATSSDPSTVPDPDVEEGIKYWESQPASYDGVLGGFGNGSLPRVDALGTRQFLMYLLPELCTVPSAIRPLHAPATPLSARRTRVLDVGAGVGRVTSDVLLHLFADVLLVEPVERFIAEAVRRGRASERASTSAGANANASIAEDANPEAAPWKGIADGSKSVTFVQATLQDFDPARPSAGVDSGKAKILGRVGYAPAEDDLDSGFDVVVCQWCLGAMSDPDLVAFFRRSKAALRDPARGFIIVKENLCSEKGEPRVVFDESDSSLTRSDLAWKQAFAEAGLRVVHEQIQCGFPEGLYPVKMYALQ
ncbi:AdoMet dependent proline di-methyltransferase-domain-containing protein [Cubamyces lactineus]|nr:AdoMet dependent proline di-methyltransferase-domain-containing protein [Cubamyces lactineus]